MPSIKSGEIMDDRRQNELPSIKTGEIMDGRRQNEMPSIKTGEIMDDRRQNELPSMKSGENMDGRSDKPAFSFDPRITPIMRNRLLTGGLQRCVSHRSQWPGGADELCTRRRTHICQASGVPFLVTLLQIP